MTSYPLFRVMIAVLIALSSVACPKGRGTEDPIAAALQRLSTATNPKVRLSALDTLRDSRDLRVNPALLKRLLEESDPTVLTALIRLVAERRLNDALPALLTIVRRVPGEPRVAATKAIVHLGGRLARARFLGDPSSPGYKLRQRFGGGKLTHQVILAAKRMHLLRKLELAKDDAQRQVALESLKLLDDPRVGPALKRMLERAKRGELPKPLIGMIEKALAIWSIRQMTTKSPTSSPSQPKR